MLVPQGDELLRGEFPMQLPGMSTDPVRLSLDLTWWPPSDDFSVSRRLWVRPMGSDTWQLEDLATTASPIRLRELPDRWSQISDTAYRSFTELVIALAEPFPDL